MDAYLQKDLSSDAQVIWGARILPEYKDRIQVITIITGVRSPFILGPVQKDEIARAKGSELGIEIIR